MSNASWWSLGDDSGYSGEDLALFRIECGFCGEEGNFEREHRSTRTSKARNKSLHYDIYKCNGCGNLTAVLWASGGSVHDYYQLPPLVRTKTFPKHWPADVGRYWLQAKRSLESENWDAAAVMAGSALQLLLRRQNAVGGTLLKEIDDLAQKGSIPPIVREWAHELRILRNDAAHPTPDSNGTQEKDAKQVVRFLRTLLTLLVDLPDDIGRYRGDKS